MKTPRASSPLSNTAACVLFVCGLIHFAAATQFLLLDTTVVHAIVPNPPYSGWHSHLNLVFAPGVPTNWTSSVDSLDYYNGVIHTRYAIIEKPTERQATYQLCINRAANQGGEWHSCTGCPEGGFKKPGVYYQEDSPAYIWYYKKPDYAHFVNGYPQLVLKGRPDGGCDCPVTSAGLAMFHCWDGYPDMTLHYPIKVHVTSYVTSHLDSFVEPNWWFEDEGVAVSTRPAPRVRPTSKLKLRAVGNGVFEIDGHGNQDVRAHVFLPGGQCLGTRTLGGDNSRLSLQHYPAGMYIVKLSAGGESVTYRTAVGARAR
jgi:hypothetical protein